MGSIKTKRIKSSKEKNLMKLDLVIIIICIIFTSFSIKESVLGTLFQYYKIYDGNLLAFINIALAMFWMFILLLVFKCFIIIAVYLGFRITRMKKIKENSRYEVIENIDYYRERFNDISPVEISLITDLEIESKKDISASILNLYQKGIIEFNGSTILVKNEDNAIRSSDKKLIEMIKNNSFLKSNIDEWKKICTKEACDNGYVTVKVNKDNKPNFKKNNMVVNVFAKIFLFSLGLSMIYILTPSGIAWYKSIDEFDIKYLQEGKSELEVIENDEEAKVLYIKILADSGPIMILSSVMIISFFVLIGTPIYRKVRSYIFYRVEINNQYERTKEGNILVEQIAGIKNFIHDFSMLSDKEKEHIVLWNDFLIYAVLLEENENIINDINKYKNINLNILNNISLLDD